MNLPGTRFQNPFDQPPQDNPKAHRGGLILLLGILGFVSMGITGAIAWYLGNKDLREINVGRMEAAGSDLSLYGKILGIVSLALYLLAALVILFVSFGSELNLAG